MPDRSFDDCPRASLCSQNEHKLAELARALPGWRLELLEADGYPPENGQTYYENARAKARFGRRTGDPELWMLGEDSGLEVDGLGGRPGIESARWAVEPVPALLGALREVGKGGRGARYVCELVCLSPGSVEYRGTGTLSGRIAPEPRGSEGFGYDPIFVPEGEQRTIAELGDGWKSQSSHRARAARDLLVTLARQKRSGPAPPTK